MTYDEYLLDYHDAEVEAEQDEKVYILHDGEQIFDSSSDISDINSEPGDFYGKSTEYIIKHCEEI